MTLSTEQHALAEALLDAYKKRHSLPISEAELTVGKLEDAYAIQALISEQKDTPIAGYKVSLTSEKTQKLFDSNEPLYGAEEQAQILTSPATVNLADFLEPLVEIELVFTATSTLSETDTLPELCEKLTVAPGIELPDSRFADWFPDLNKYLVVSDGAVGGNIVLGASQPVSAISFDELGQIEGTLFVDDEQVAQGLSSEVLSNPLISVQWLIKKLAQSNQQITEGMHISSGTFIFPVPLRKGTFKAVYSHGIGEVVVHAK